VQTAARDAATGVTDAGVLRSSHMHESREDAHSRHATAAQHMHSDRSDGFNTALEAELEEIRHIDKE